MIDGAASRVNEFCVIGNSPLHDRSVLHPNRGPSSDVVAAWTFEPGEIAPGSYTFSGDVSACHDEWAGNGTFSFRVSEGSNGSDVAVEVKAGQPSRFSLNFSSQGGPVRFVASYRIASHDMFEGSGIHVSTIAIDGAASEFKPNIHMNMYIVRPHGDAAFSDTSRGYLISENQGGFTNRINSILSVMRVAREMKRQPLVWWSPNTHCAAALEDIFDVGDGIQKISISDHDFSQTSHYNFYDGNQSQVRIFDDARNVIVSTIQPFPTRPALRYGPIDLGREFKSLPLSKDIQGMLQPWEGFDFSRTIGFHLRRPFPGKQFAELEAQKFDLPISSFIEFLHEVIRSHPENQKILLCANDFEAERQVRDEFGDRIIVFEKSTIDNTQDPRAVQEAVVDLMLMSRCPILFSQTGSGFAAFAHALSNNKFYMLNYHDKSQSRTITRFMDGEMHDTDQYASYGAFKLKDDISR